MKSHVCFPKSITPAWQKGTNDALLQRPFAFHTPHRFYTRGHCPIARTPRAGYSIDEISKQAQSATSRASPSELLTT
jgi:hypothetical protein